MLCLIVLLMKNQTTQRVSNDENSNTNQVTYQGMLTFDLDHD